MSDKTHLVGSVDRIVFRSPDTDWSVLRVTDTKANKAVTVVGHSACQPGQSIEAFGYWQTKKPYGRQFTAESIVATYPTTAAALASYIASGIVSGVGERLAMQMVQHFGTDLIDIMQDSPDRLCEVPGIGPTKAKRICEGWRSQAALNDIMLFLHAQGLSSSLCKRIHKALGDDAVRIIKTDPYRLSLDVHGIGFATADKVAIGLGVPPKSPQRILAGLVSTMDDLTRVGHCGCERPRFVSAASATLSLDESVVNPVLDDVLLLQDADARFEVHDEIIYPVRLAQAEAFIASRLRGFALSYPGYAIRVDDALIRKASSHCSMVLTDKQHKAVKAALTSRVSVITGGPGCGKTATLHVLLEACRMLNLSVSLAAPTGKAAQRAREATGVEAKTVHRLLGISGFGLDDDITAIGADILVVDEMSMVDVPLMRKIMSALDTSVGLVMVGDVDQLPSVGPGQVLRDVIDSKAVNVTVLDQVFRQASGSHIITNAHAINAGHLPSSSGPKGDFFVMTERNEKTLNRIARTSHHSTVSHDMAEATAHLIEELVTRRLPKAYNFDPILDIQVLSPMNKGACGVKALNVRLQAALNPSPAERVQVSGHPLGTGDKVLQLRNNYALGVFNGDVGTVDSIDHENKAVQVCFDSGMVSVPFSDLSDLTTAYAITVHKSQGSQVPAVVMPMVTEHWNMLQRNLLYTAVTRASKLVVIVGQHRALAAAVRTATDTARVTRLATLMARAAHKGRPHLSVVA